MVVGYDRRFLSDQFASAAAEVLSANAYEVVLADRPTPTPAISHAVVANKARGGIMITASHNSPSFNGFKLKAAHGGPADSDLCHAVEALLGRTRPRRQANEKGGIRVKNILPAYYRAIKKLVDFRLISKATLNFTHEPLYGVGAGCFDELLAGTRCRVRTFHAEHDPNFGGICPEPIPRNYEPAGRLLRREPADFCLVTDGDADRIGGMDGRGRPLTTHQIICLLLNHFIRNRKGRGRVVKALTTTSMVDKICAASGLPLVETGVGFKYICAEMLKGDVLLGFEESGGVGFPGHVPDRDGILAGLMVLEMLAMERKPLDYLLKGLVKMFGPHCYGRLDMHFPMERRAALLDKCAGDPPARLLRSPVAEVKSFDGVKLVAANDSWLMWRGSGTEPVLRIYAEASSESEVQRLLRQGKRQAISMA
jgi:phosphomannomutase